MQFEQVFSSAIEVGVATAGFSGIVVVLGQRAQGEWSPADLGRVSVLLQSSLAAILLSFLALVLHGAGVADSSIWRIGSGTHVVYTAVQLPLRLRQMRGLHEVDTSYSASLTKLVIPVLICVFALQIYNTATLAAGWAFAVAVIAELVVAFLMFVRLLEAIWRHPAA
ncbi:MAG: hypothetical protein ACQGVC_05855 [Myxococcota bacterium]